MVIVKLLGGLGNQFFMYATARRLAHFRNEQLKLDIMDTGFRNNNIPYKLGHFNIIEDFANASEIYMLKGKNINRIKKFLFNIKTPHTKASYKKEQHFYFDPVILNLDGGVYLDGYWQSEKYFSDIKSIIRREFTLKEAPDAKNMEVANRISACESVGIHLRRGYLVTDLKNFHGICNLNYYLKSIEHLVKRISKPVFFIFSDDTDWVKNNFSIPYSFSIIDINDSNNDYYDLNLMSFCKHQIIANSTFSWWAAWLNENPNKIVIAPQKWFNDPYMSANTQDLIPENWIKI